jgi:uncharacterized protein YegJ (DUF2314 family)
MTAHQLGQSTRYRFTIAAALAFVFAIIAACSAPKDPTISVSADDREMNLAISQARESLPRFWEVFEAQDRGESDFALKVRIEDPNGVEHFWVTDLRREAGKIYGFVGNEANTVRRVKLGDEIEVPPDDITDWLYMRDGKMVGNFTVRPLFKEMRPEEVQRLKAMMAEP